VVDFLLFLPPRRGRGFFVACWNAGNFVADAVWIISVSKNNREKYVGAVAVLFLFVSMTCWTLDFAEAQGRMAQRNNMARH